ncbi:MAG TPA: AAA family ATPase, partial [Solirubrobacteraceae bacterium]|nr:AAA family ATPase [Solirubrobacteraceae bacterium]
MEGIVGRERELLAVAALIEPAATACFALALDGEPGIGKTSVLERGVALGRERGYTVLGCRPVESESALAFVSLGDLLEPVASDAAVRAMPAIQQRALETALARRPPGEAFGRHAVSRATLAVLRALADDAPVLIAIDDAQWLDASTEAVLRFALRRLRDSPVRALLALRSERGVQPSVLGGEVAVQRIAIGPLSADELGRVVADRLDVSLARPRLAELHATSGGNPYFALEIVRALLARGEPVGSGGPLRAPESIAVLLRARLARRSPAALDVLLLAAASPQPTASRTERVAGSAEGLREAVAEGMLEHDGDRLRFTHPLLASVVYAGADPLLRREAHARLAAATDDPDERAAHLARATADPDETVAADLSAAAHRAARRGAPATAAELEEHALRLTPPDLDELRFARSLRTAEYRLAAGDTERGRLLLERLLETSSHPARRARLALRLGQVRYTSDDVAAARALFDSALAEAGDDDGLRAEAEQALAFTAMLGGDIPTALARARSSLRLAERAGEPRILSLALCRVGLTQFLGGHGLDRPLFERALELETDHLDEVPVEWLPSYAFAWSCLMADDLPAARALYEQLARTAEERGDERFTASVLFATSELETRAGNWGAAVRLAAEAVERSRQSGLGTIHAWALCAKALVAAHLGQV